MNCCDEYGNCRQGRDCPIRQQMSVEDDLDTSWLPIIVDIAGILLLAFVLTRGT